MTYRVLAFAALVAALAVLLWDIDNMALPSWDESWHALIALRMAAAAKAGDLIGAFHEFCSVDRYPPLARAGMALGFVAWGLDWSSPRAATAVAFVLSVAVAARLSRRLVKPEDANVAAFFTTLFGLCGWLSVAHASTAMIEPWAALMLVLAVNLFARAWESGRARDGAVAGVVIAANLLVKYNYVVYLLLALAGAVVGTLLVKPKELHETPSNETGWTALRRRAGVLGWTAGAAACVWLWWFILPLPLGLDAAAGHRFQLVDFLTNAVDLGGGTEARDLIFGIPILGFGSLPLFAIHLGGVALAVARRGSMVWRLTAFLAVGGPVALAIYPYREERFLIPTLAAAWPLGGAFCAVCVGRLRGVKLGIAVAILTGALYATLGLGTGFLVRAASGHDRAPEDVERYAAILTRRARHPYGAFRGRSFSPDVDDELRMLDLAAENIDPRRRFAWIGGTTSHYPVARFCWRVYQHHRVAMALYNYPSQADPMMVSSEWTRDSFRDWSHGFEQIVVLDPPPPNNLGRGDWELLLIAWLKADPSFTSAYSQPLQFEWGKSTLTIHRLAGR